METPEIEKLVGELEIAVDRLRSLYEQYFMGIEKIEPGVPRKDVDRRIHLLRKEQIRNTAQRFRFQMVLQRYNTYQTHWQRICREIENGTYKRHVIRAQQRLGDGPTSSRRRSTAPPAAAAAAAPIRGPLTEALAAELAELDVAFAPAAGAASPAPSFGPEPSTGSNRKAPPPPVPTAARQGPPPGAGRPPPLPPRVAGQQPGQVRPPLPPPRGATAAAAPPVPAAPAASSAVAPPRPPSPPTRPVQTQALQPAAPRPPAPAVRPTATAPQPRPVPPPSKDELGDDRLRQIYAQYVETKRQRNESTAAITYDAVARSLRDATAKLKERHGKNIDFEVTVKDGKTILKPVLK